jgi:hypothetical protein
MSLRDKISEGIGRAVKATESAIDEGKLRVSAFAARQRADKAAAVLGYEVARAKAAGRPSEPDALARLIDAANAADSEATALEAKVRPGASGDATGQP